MKNVVFWIGVKNDQYSEKYGGWDWMDVSKNSWKYWCEKNDVLFVPFETPIESDLIKFRINWQKAIFVFDELDRQGINYDQIYLVDASTVIKWDAPNVFEMTDHKFVGWRDMDNLGWIYTSIKGYESFFDYKLDASKYFSSGAIIFNKDHKHIFESFKQLYYDNIDSFIKLQDESVRKGTEQTPLNYWIQINNVNLKTDLPPEFKLTHMHRYELFSHNWQLNEDMTPFFIKYGYLWSFNGIEKNKRSEFMINLWNYIKHNYE